MKVETHRVRVIIERSASRQVLVMLRAYPRGKIVLLPGGGIDEGETPEAAAIREVKEELGVTLTKMRYVQKFVNERPIDPVEVSLFPGATSVVSNLHFFMALNGQPPKPVLMEPDKFQRMDWVDALGVYEYARSHNARVGDGLLGVLDDVYGKA